MLISDSMSLLWTVYGVLSLVVLVTGYLGLAFLPRLPRLVLTWAVAGLMWMPSAFELPLVEEGQVYHGQAPAVLVAGVALLDGSTGVLVPAATLAALGAALGAGFGLLLWWLGHRRRVRKAEEARREARREDEQAPKPGDGDKRREPVLG